MGQILVQFSALTKFSLITAYVPCSKPAQLPQPLYTGKQECGQAHPPLTF